MKKEWWGPRLGPCKWCRLRVHTSDAHGYAGCRHWSCKRRCNSSLQFCSDKTQSSSAIMFKPFQVCSIYIHLASHWSFPHFIESKISFPRSQKPDSCPFPMSPVKSYHPVSLTAISILSSCLCLGLKWSLFFRLPHQTLVCSSLLPHTCHMSYLSHPWFDRQNNIWQEAQTMQILIMQFPPSLCSSAPFSRLQDENST